MCDSWKIDESSLKTGPCELREAGKRGDAAGLGEVIKGRRQGVLREERGWRATG